MRIPSPVRPLAGAVSEFRRLVGRRGRRVWRGETRFHLELRALPPEKLKTLIPEFEAALGRVPGVVWVRLHPALHSVVVQYSHRALARWQHSLPDTQKKRKENDSGLDAFEKALVEAMESVEAAHDLKGFPFSSTSHPEQHPGDWMPLARTFLEMGLDVGSIAGGLLFRTVGIKPLPREIDLAAIVEIVGNIPGARSFVERYASISFTEIGLELSSAALNIVLHSELGSATSALDRYLRWRELRARRHLWLSHWEERMCAVRGRRATGPFPEPRPRPLPEGSLERYSAKAALGSLGAFAGTLFATGSLGPADAAIFAGVPKPARLARDAFASQLGYRLAHAGVMVMTPKVLRHLDKLDRLVFPATLVAADKAGVQRLLEKANRAGLHGVVVGNGSTRVGAMRIVDKDDDDAVRLLQEEGHGVLFVGRGPSPAYAAADCSLGLWSEGSLPPWGAHLHCDGGLAQAAALIEAVAVARRATAQAMEISLAEVVFGVALSSVGVKEKTTRQIMMAVSTTSMLAMANGVRLAQGVKWPRPETEVAPPPWHRMTVREALGALESSPAGLSPEEAAARRMPRPAKPSSLRQFLHISVDELKSPMTPVLAAGTALSLLSGAAVDAVLIASVMLINGVYGAAQRFHVERLIREISRHENHLVTAWRRGERCAVIDDELVPGDIVELATGDVVPADCRILLAAGLEIDESSLTGESLPVSKRAAPSSGRQLAERRSMVYEGTAVTAGTATVLVVAVNDDTEAHRAGRMATERAVSAGVETRLQALTELTAPLAAASGVVLAAAERLRGQPMREALSTAVSLAVAAVPEGLPLLAGLSQLAVAGRLSQRGALVRNPRAIEALGRVNVLCADKTGTLTEGRIRLALVSDGLRAQRPDALDESHRRILAVALRASPSTANDSPIPHLTDRALIEGARRMQVGSHDDLQEWQRLHEMPFEPRRAFHASLAQHREGQLISVKGAPEAVLPRCVCWRQGKEEFVLGEPERQQLLEQAMALAGKGYRVLAVAERAANGQRAVQEERVKELVFHGFVAFADPVRPTARAALNDLHRAGIKVVMLTGDHPSTAAAIAADLGLQGGRAVLTGAELETMSNEELARRVPEVHVFARVTPAHKVRIVRAFQEAGRVVGMTGDGVNDAPAIRLADVGIALGEHSTTVARRAADMVVADGRIETIVSAVLEGRALWLSVRDAVSLLVGGNLGEILFTLVGGLAGGGSPLNARQLLLVNLLTDAVPALAVALRPPKGKTPEDLLKAGPETSLGQELFSDIGWRAAITAGATSVAWFAARMTGSRQRAGTVALLALTGTQLAQTIAAGRGSRTVLYSSLASLAALLAVVETPGVSQFFGSRPVGPIGLLEAGTAAVAGGIAHATLPRVVRVLRLRALPRMPARLRARPRLLLRATAHRS